jgi:hypothetical protein
MKTSSLLSFLALPFAMILALSSCASSNVATNVDSTINFPAYRTFAWLPDASWRETKFDNLILQRGIEHEGVRILTAKGYVVDTLYAEFLVHHHIAVEFRMRDIQAQNYSYAPNKSTAGYGYYYSMYQPMMVSNQFAPIPYREGTLIVDIIDRKQQRLVWRGWSAQSTDNMADFDRSLEKRLKDILLQFPASIISAR